MRIALVSEHASPLAVLGGADAGGQNVHVSALAHALARRGMQVTVYTRRDSARLPPLVPLTDGVTVEHVDAGPPEPLPKDELLPFMDAFAQRLAAAWQRERPDIVHAHFWMSGLASLAAAEPLGLPVIQTFHALGAVKRRHQGAADTSPAQRLALERGLIGRTAGIIATCRDEVRELRQLGADPHRIRVVPCGIELGAFRPEGAAEPRGPWPQRIVVVTRLVERKGVSDVIEAVAGLPDTELVVAGGPQRESLLQDPEGRRLLACRERLAVAERVDLRGRVAHSDVPALLRSADVVACVPWYEPFGMVPVEAMACGVPVVGSAVGGLLDTVIDGTTGVLVPPRDPDRLRAALALLLRDAHQRARMGAAAAVRAHLRYGWTRIATATLSAYESLAAAHSRTDARQRERSARGAGRGTALASIHPRGAAGAARPRSSK